VQVGKFDTDPHGVEFGIAHIGVPVDRHLQSFHRRRLIIVHMQDDAVRRRYRIGGNHDVAMQFDDVDDFAVCYFRDHETGRIGSCYGGQQPYVQRALIARRNDRVHERHVARPWRSRRVDADGRDTMLSATRVVDGHRTGYGNTRVDSSHIDA